jgi:hypothetical protein
MSYSSSSSSSSPISFIWIGGLLTEKQISLATPGPMSCSSLYPERKITLWLSENSLRSGAEIFKDYKNIELRSVEGFMRGDYEGGLKHLTHKSLEYVKKHFELIGQMEKDNPEKNSMRFVMQKDLMSMAILFEYGGYFFDTTTMFEVPGRLEDFLEPKLPCIAEDMHMDFGKDADVVNIFDFTDIWGMYTPTPAHEFLTNALSTMSSVFFSAEPPFSLDHQKSLSFSISDSIENAFKDLYQKDPPEKSLWQTSLVDQGSSKVWSVEELGMQKKNASSWRTDSSDYPEPPASASALVFSVMPREETLRTTASEAGGGSAGAATGESGGKDFPS